MRKTHFLLIGMLLISCITVNLTAPINADEPHGTRSPDAGVEITPPSNKTGAPTETVSYSFIVNNTGDQTDNFTVVKGMAKVVLYDGRENSPTYGEANEFFMGEHNPILLVIPPYVLHGMKGIGTEPAYLINCPTESYDHDSPDEYRVAQDSGEVPYDWELKKR